MRPTLKKSSNEVEIRYWAPLLAMAAKTAIPAVASWVASALPNLWSKQENTEMAQEALEEYEDNDYRGLENDLALASLLSSNTFENSDNNIQAYGRPVKVELTPTKVLIVTVPIRKPVSRDDRYFIDQVVGLGVGAAVKGLGKLFGKKKKKKNKKRKMLERQRARAETEAKEEESPSLEETESTEVDI